MTEKAERIPLTISDNDPWNGTVTIVFKAIGKSTQEMAKYKVGDTFLDVVGPLGRPSEFIHMSYEERKTKRYVFIGGMMPRPERTPCLWPRGKPTSSSVPVPTAFSYTKMNFRQCRISTSPQMTALQNIKVSSQICCNVL